MKPLRRWIPGAARAVRAVAVPFLGATALLLAPPVLVGQSPSGGEALEEIRSLLVRVDVTGSAGSGAGVAGALEDVILGELDRADILRWLREPRAGDCCELRLDVRTVAGPPRLRGIVAYSARLELGFRDRVGRIEGWTVLWSGQTLGPMVGASELPEQLRFITRELAVEFVERYRERFPAR